ncbi:transporter [Malaciobacter pacificus]|uniref:EamA/RhaT family transporter n=1 Tax=Malaciobacter pacificus TaxID=1080223 RepID=A0A5C2H3U6_9BACT|nr:DMT family transporter [Malaciobacter pacificus]QEP33423.1 EamA/RhaT family transporter [Malaciobacter pacificus]GGD31326.1 transporter [Malaciobacter pacificus]
MQYYVLLLLTVLFWSGNFIVGRYISSEISPMELSFYRWFIVLVILLPFFIFHFKNIMQVFKKQYLNIILLGALSVTGFNTFLYYGLQTTTATNALLINSSTPIFIILFSALILKTTMSKVQWLGIVLSTFGVVYLILKGEIDHFFDLTFTSGDLWIIAACIDWALYSVLLKFKPKELNAFEFLTVTTIIGVVIIYGVFLYQGYSFSFDFVKNDDVLYSMIYIVIFPSLLSFYFWNISTPQVGANKAGQFAHIMPISGAALAYIFLDEVLYFYHLIGLILIFLGIYLSIFYKRKVF